MDWNAFVEGIKEFFNQIVPIIGCTIGALCIAVLSILSKTSIGKKSIKKLTNLYNEGKGEINKFYNEYQEFKANKEEQIAIIKSEYENKLAIVAEQYNDLKDLFYLIAEVEPNKKVKEIIERFKVNANTEIKGISQVVDAEVEKAKDTYKSVFEKELKAIQENYTKIIVDMQTEILALKEQVSVNFQKEIESASNDLLDTKEKIIEKVGE